MAASLTVRAQRDALARGEQQAAWSARCTAYRAAHRAVAAEHEHEHEHEHERRVVVNRRADWAAPAWRAIDTLAPEDGSVVALVQHALAPSQD